MPKSKQKTQNSTSISRLDNGRKTSSGEAEKAVKSQSQRTTPLTETPVSPGLVLVQMPPSGQLDAEFAILKQVVQGGNKALIQFPSGQAVVRLLACSNRDFEKIKAQGAKFGLSQESHFEYRHVGESRHFNFCAEESRRQVLDTIQSTQGWTVFGQPLDHINHSVFVQAMLRLRTFAKSKKRYVMVFISSTKALADIDLAGLCDELLIVDACEPDPDADAAFSVTNTAFAELQTASGNKVMWQVKYIDDNVKSRWSSFIAADLTDRMMWLMKASGMNLTEIGKAVGLHKSNVLRRLKTLTPVRKDDPLVKKLSSIRKAIDDGYNQTSTPPTI